MTDRLLGVAGVCVLLTSASSAGCCWVSAPAWPRIAPSRRAASALSTSPAEPFDRLKRAV
jgi:hypothetical protein